MYLTENGCSLFWLWVAPEYRRKGAGGTLLDEMCKIALQTSGGNLSVTYPADAPWAYAMEYMLVSRGFRVRVHSYPQYRVTREQLLDRIWGYEYVGDTRTVDVHVKRIREKLNSEDEWGIRTVWSVGYKFGQK